MPEQERVPTAEEAWLRDLDRLLDKFQVEIGVAHETTVAELRDNALAQADKYRQAIRNALCAALQRAETAEAELDRLFTAAVRWIHAQRQVT